MFQEGSLTHYLIFTNRRKTGGAEDRIPARITSATGVEHVWLRGLEDIERELLLHPRIAKAGGRQPADPPPARRRPFRPGRQRPQIWPATTETSSNLVDWSTIGVAHAPTGNSDTGTPKFRAEIAIIPGNPQFLRIRLVQP